jgi:hypothetical protein
MRAGRPALLGALFVLGVFLLFLIPNRAICPVAVPVGTGPIECAGWTEVMRTVLLAVVLQDPPAGILLPGVASTLLWILLRIAGVITLASITVVYRNQVGR